MKGMSVGSDSGLDMASAAGLSHNFIKIIIKIAQRALTLRMVGFFLFQSRS